MKKCIVFMGVVVITLSIHTAYAQDGGGQKNANEMLHEADESVTMIENIIDDGQQKLSDAKKESDVAKMDCLNSNLINAKGFYSVVQNAQTNLSDAIKRNDAEAQVHHYKMVQLGTSKAQEAASRMAECTSGIIGVTGTTVSETIRKCSVEPCLGGEQFYEPSKENTLGNTGKVTAEDLDESMNVLDVDASAYL